MNYVKYLKTDSIFPLDRPLSSHGNSTDAKTIIKKKNSDGCCQLEHDIVHAKSLKKNNCRPGIQIFVALKSAYSLILHFPLT